MTPQEFREFLKEEILVLDGATGTMVQNYEFGPEVYGGEEYQMLSDLLIFSRPDASKAIHLRYFEAGANAVETNTFGASPLRLAEFDFSRLDLKEFPALHDGADLRKISLNEFTYRLNYNASQIAQQAIAEYKQSPDYDGRQLFVVGSIGPSNWVLSSTHADLKKGTFDQIEDNFYQQSLGLIDGGADILLFETQQDILELKVGIFGAKRAMKEKGKQLPIMAQVTVDQFSRMQIFSTDIHAALTTIQDIGVDAFGINCSIGPDLMGPTVRKLCKYSKIPISVIPNAGLPSSEAGKTVFKLTPDELAGFIKEFVQEQGVNIVGGCCGTTPEHIKAVTQAIKGLKPKPRKIDSDLYISGPQNAIKLDGDDTLIRFGERLNVRGSKKVRIAVEESDEINQDALEEVVNEQVKDLGVEVIDICMDSNIVDTAATLVSVIQGQTIDFPAAMCIDSFDVNALAEAIKVYPGRPIINSISLEEYSPGLDKIDAVLQVTEDHSPIYIALTTGPKGPAMTCEQKVDLASQILDKVKDKYDVDVSRIFVDINAFPIGSESIEGMNFAMESIRAIPLIKQLYPGVHTTIGVGNLTNGLAKKPYMRKVLTSIFLDEARKVGLDAAIINPNHYVPVESLDAGDYDLGKRIIQERDMDAFSELEEVALRKKGGPIKKKVVYDELPTVEAVCLKIKNGFKDRTEGVIEVQGRGYKYIDRIVPQIVELIADIEPLDLINDHLMKAMEELGAGFAEGTVSLPHLLKSADVMKQVMGFLESYMKRDSDDAEGGPKTKGTIILGTVYQDVHSIGKDLAKTLLENYGFKVVDLGVQVPLQKFIDEAKAHNADAIGSSALLVQTSNHMITLATLMNEQGMSDLPLLIGGAPVTNRHASFVAMNGDQDVDSIRDNIFYCHSAMDGVNILTQLIDPVRKKKLLKENKELLIRSYLAGVKHKAKQETLLKTLPKRKVDFKEFHPAVDPGPVRKAIYSMEEFLPHLDRKQLFALNWKYGGKGSWARKGIEAEELETKLLDLVRLVDSKGWIRPQGLYGLFPCKRKAGEVEVFHPTSGKLLGSFIFNDVIGYGKKDIFNTSQFFQTKQMDLIGVQFSTAGPHVDDVVNRLKVDDQEAAWLLQGLSDRVAEDMADRLNGFLEQLVWGEEGGKSTRYSPGYPAMVEMKNNQLCAELLSAVQDLGIRITDGYEFAPTGSTAAVVCFHPKADYR
ncbi:MAG: 5-methyltetrahydrofolate--homocysteine methyltransferase [SAR324 cluster bacterium]|uniref:Methionine synthase n=1 Tax=SAR324 cluster bacterium TaxID=2024889 RepID=A0A2A4ST33_9DELT|nr:MAG: 5-methyltetrahydrofolate--homocysteine methyltransferase [SAR324 cluster bacterium]